MKPLLTETQIREGVEQIGGQVRAFYDGKPLTIIGVLTGSVIFLADLIRQLHGPMRVGVIQARSYRGDDTRPGPLEINADLLPEIEGRHVLLVDDIFDTGHTLSELTSQLEKLRPASIRSAVLLKKHGRQEVAIEPQHVAFEIPDEFVVGYGLDHDDMFRNLPYVAVLEPEDFERASTRQEDRTFPR